MEVYSQSAAKQSCRDGRGAATNQKKNPRIFPPRCFLLASSWSMMPPEVVSTTCPNCLEGRRLLVHFSISLMPMSNLGEITPHLLRRPVRLMTILPALWSSTTSNSPMYPCFIMTVRNLMTTLEQGRTMTCLLPLFSALLMHLRQSASEFIRTILDYCVLLSCRSESSN